jgi:predicted RNA-binding Zn-ribbon protein involved in translation (DUF1610 family)
MAEHLVGQPLTKVTVFQCPQCSRIIRRAETTVPYPCPWGCGSKLIVLRTEWEDRGAGIVTPVEET